MLVHTSETMRYRYFLDLLMARSRPVMLVGAAGSGKTVLLQDKLSSKFHAVPDPPGKMSSLSISVYQVLEKTCW